MRSLIIVFIFSVLTPIFAMAQINKDGIPVTETWKTQWKHKNGHNIIVEILAKQDNVKKIHKVQAGNYGISGDGRFENHLWVMVEKKGGKKWSVTHAGDTSKWHMVGYWRRNCTTKSFLKVPESVPETCKTPRDKNSLAYSIAKIIDSTNNSFKEVKKIELKRKGCWGYIVANCVSGKPGVCKKYKGHWATCGLGSSSKAKTEPFQMIKK